jgi:hypothetical protein
MILTCPLCDFEVFSGRNDDATVDMFWTHIETSHGTDVYEAMVSRHGRHLRCVCGVVIEVIKYQYPYTTHWGTLSFDDRQIHRALIAMGARTEVCEST